MLRYAAEQLGITTFLEPPADIHIEGGDVLAACQDGKRTLFVGVGARTTMEAGLWLAENLVRRHHADQIVCFRHNRALLHLDTCFAILPNNLAICAQGSLLDGFVIDYDLVAEPINPSEYLASAGYQTLHISRADAEQHENCNMLYLGDNRYLSFVLPTDIKQAIEDKAGITIHEIDGSEISKANGGVHCLTRPIY
jgi:N-dimethylarginine dimethylaminohydrolase